MRTTRIIFFSFLFAGWTGTASAQNIAINTTGATANASAMLDITSTTSGLLIPRMTSVQRAAIGGPAQGLIVYDVTLNAFYYYNAGWWPLLSNSSSTSGGWSLTGNAGTTAGTNFIGTTDVVDWVIKTSNTERMRITSGGLLGLGTAAPSYLFTIGGTGNIFGVDNMASFAARNSASGYETYFWPRWSDNIMYMNYGSAGFNIRNNGSGSTMFMTNGNFVGIGTTAPLYRLHVQGTIAGSYVAASFNTDPGGYALIGQNTAASGAGVGIGVVGITAQNTGFGLYGKNNNTTGTAVFGAGNNIAGTYLTAGSGGAFTGTVGAAGFSTSVNGTGLYGFASDATGFSVWGINSNANGTAIVGSGNNLGGNYLGAGSGGAFTGLTWGAYIINTSFGTSGAIYTSNGGVINRYNYYNGTQYKVLGTGAVSTTVEDVNGKKVVMHCAEAPEILFEDYGEGKLTEGKAHIVLDPTFAKNVAINDKHPLRVYIQLEGDCNGVYVTNKTSFGFDVIELKEGSSDIRFQYHVICNTADQQITPDKLSKNADVRFEPAPEPEPVLKSPLLKQSRMDLVLPK
jgi:hypothetical protein